MMMVVTMTITMTMTIEIMMATIKKLMVYNRLVDDIVDPFVYQNTMIIYTIYNISNVLYTKYLFKLEDLSLFYLFKSIPLSNACHKVYNTVVLCVQHYGNNILKRNFCRN